MTTCIIIPWFNYWRTKNTQEFGPLKRVLEKEGHKVYLFDYEERPNDLENLLNRLKKLIKKTDSKKVALIGFSLGSFIAVKFIEKFGSKNIDKTLLCIPLINASKSFKAIYKLKPSWINESGRVLHQASYEKLDPESIPKNVKVGIISGTKRMHWKKLISYLSQGVHLTNKNDGLFSIQEGKFGRHEQLILNVNHYTAPRDKKIYVPILNFIDKGTFKQSKGHEPLQN